MDNQVLIALIGVIYILGEIIKFRVSKKNGNHFTSEHGQMLRELVRLHSKTDLNGVPLQFFPRRDFELVLAELKKINENFEKYEFFLPES